jgi:polysaccharide chain length determinant protein (PEP-CTERM system associated)
VNTSKTLLLSYGRAMWRRKWYGALVAWVICVAGWATVAVLPNIFEARTRIYVDTDSMLRPLMRGIAVDSNVLNLVDVMQRTLLSRPNLQKVIHMADLDLASGRSSDGEEFINDLRRQISITSEGRNLFTIAYTGPNRATATKVIQSLLTVFVETNLGSSRQDMQAARAFIDQQLKSYAAQLDQAEKRMSDFKGKNVGFLPTDSGNYAVKLDQVRQDVARAQTELDDATQRRNELLKQLASVPKMVDSVSAGDFGPGPPLGEVTDAGGVPIDPRLADLQAKLKEMQLSYTDQHPDVIKLKRQIQQVQDASKAAAKSAPAAQAQSGGYRSSSPNPVYEQLTIQEITLESQIASLKARLAGGQAETERLQSLAASVPAVAAEMSKLSRDYDVIKKSYDELLNRREAAKIGNDLETQTQTIQFRIIDPPDAPPIPVAPKRALLVSAVLLVALAAGMGFTFMLAKVDDSVKSISELREFFNVPVLGAISLIHLPMYKRRTMVQAAGFAASCVALVVTYAGIMSVILLTSIRV